MADLSHKSVPVEIPKLPQYQPLNTHYVMISPKNIFASSQLLISGPADVAPKYNLNQLQMVGFMHYESQDYAFLKTPYATLRVKVGDKVQQGIVALIKPDAAEIDEIETESDKKFVKKIYLQLKTTSSKILSDK